MHTSLVLTPIMQSGRVMWSAQVPAYLREFSVADICILRLHVEVESSALAPPAPGDKPLSHAGVAVVAYSGGEVHLCDVQTGSTFVPLHLWKGDRAASLRRGVYAEAAAEGLKPSIRFFSSTKDSYQQEKEATGPGNDPAGINKRQFEVLSREWGLKPTLLAREKEFLVVAHVSGSLRIWKAFVEKKNVRLTQFSV